jgi:hypothetical protein
VPLKDQRWCRWHHSMAANRLILPGDTDRITIIGQTGSGKTQGAIWQLSQRSFDKMPWVVFNWKLDASIDAIPGAVDIGLDASPPRKPGIYRLHPRPDDAEAVDSFLWRVWERGGIGLYIDEGYMIPPRSSAFQAILTQGRSKRIPVITLTQRPLWLSRFALSEAEYIQLYKLNDTRDIDVVARFMPLPIHTPLPGKYYSWWFDGSRDYKAVLQPVPDMDTILDGIRLRTRKPKRIL